MILPLLSCLWRYRRHCYRCCGKSSLAGRLLTASRCGPWRWSAEMNHTFQRAAALARELAWGQSSHEQRSEAMYTVLRQMDAASGAASVRGGIKVPVDVPV